MNHSTRRTEIPAPRVPIDGDWSVYMVRGRREQAIEVARVFSSLRGRLNRTAAQWAARVSATVHARA